MLSYKEKQTIIDYITKKDSFMLMALCEYLIENGSSSATFSSGRYKIFPLVGAFIKEQVAYEIEHIDNDVEFKKNDNTVELDVKETIKEEKSEPGQLSLF